MTKFACLLALNIAVIVYLPIFGLWALDYLTISQEFISIFHLIIGVGCLYLFWTLISHASSNKSLGDLKQVGWLLFLIGFGPISWLIYLIAYKKKF